MADWVAGVIKLLKELLVGDTSIHISTNKKSNKTIIKNTVGGNQYIQNNSIAISEENINKLADILHEKAFKQDVIFINDDSQKLLTNVAQFEKDPITQDTLKFFRPLIPNSDFIVLRSGLYIKHLTESGEDPKNIKSGIIVRYGERGKNIANLASAGYFTSHIKPLYEQMSSEDGFVQSQFSDEYEKIINEVPFAIFVHSGKSVEYILKEIEDKTKIKVKYHVDNDIIAVHGFGANADIIEESKIQLDKIYGKVDLESYFSGIKITILKVYYKSRVKQ